MKIDYSSKLQKFMVTGLFTELEDIRAIPNRKFDKTSGIWFAGLTKANVNYLRRWQHRFTPEAAAMAQVVEKGSVVRKGSLPMGFQFKTDPKPHQLEPLLRMQVCDDYALVMDPGTGKTKVIIDDSVVHFIVGKINAVLVVCPNSIKSNWEDEILKHGSGRHEIFIHDPGSKKAAERFMKTRFEGSLKWLIMAVESFSQGSAFKFAQEFLAVHQGYLALDESSRIKNHDRERTLKILGVGRFAKYRRIATGTPISKGLHQAWPQYEFLNPSILDMGYYAFRNHFCVMGGYKSKKIIGTIHQEEFIDLVAPYTYRVSKAECLKDLPPKIYQVREVEPSQEQARIYGELKSKGIAKTGDKFLSFGNTLVRDLRLQQIAGGFVVYNQDIDPPGPNDDLDEYFNKLCHKSAEPIPGGNPKITELMSIIDEAPGKVIIWSRFKPEILAISEALREEYGDESVVEFHGDVNNNDRTIARRRFQEDPKCLFFVGQISTGGIGITLTAASVVVYFGNAWPLEDRIQSEDRAHRIGQCADSVLYIDLVIKAGVKWVDSAILEALKDGKDYTDVILGQMEIATR